MDIAKLKAELDAGTYSADDALAAGELNAENVVRNRDSIAPGEMQAAVVGSEFAALSAVQQRAWLAILADSVDPGNVNIVEQITAIWAGTTTLTNLSGIKTETVSRAVELRLGKVWPAEVTQARAYHG